jgi:hypothetical protein
MIADQTDGDGGVFLAEQADFLRVPVLKNRKILLAELGDAVTSAVMYARLQHYPIYVHRDRERFLIWRGLRLRGQTSDIAREMRFISRRLYPAIFRLPHRILHLLDDVHQSDASQTFVYRRFGYGNRDGNRHTAKILHMGKESRTRQTHRHQAGERVRSGYQHSDTYAFRA